METLRYRPVTQRHRLDLIEVCAPIDSPLTKIVLRRGGKAERFGLHNAGFSNDMKISWARNYAATMKPRHMWLSPPCTMFSQMQNANPWYKKTDEEKRDYKRRFARALLIFSRCLIWAMDQLSRGGEVHFESPLHSKCWTFDSRQSPLLR